jgi:FtsP/CotA-like multicopper oxidase with cupredoxin domain
MNRRNFLRRTSLLGAGMLASQSAAAGQQNKPAAQEHPHQDHTTHENPKTVGATPNNQAQVQASGESGFPPVHAPDLSKLPYKMEDGVKVFHLIAEPVRVEFLPKASWADARLVDVWGYNGSCPGPTIEVAEGDRVKILFTNNLPEPTAPHWHGLEVPMSQDGVPGIGQPLIMPGETYTYEFTLHQNGTFFYHSHMAMQEMMGMIGLFIVHPKQPHEPRVDKDFAIILQEWAILPNNTVPNTLAMEFNWLTMNGKAGPATTPVIVKQGERVRIRMVNLGMDHHPIHLHGQQFVVTGTEGGRAPESTWYPGNTVLVGVAQARDVEFVAKYEGDWMLHCHLPHHMMNQMVSMVGPLAHAGHGMQTGRGMDEGMGMISRGGALSDDLGPSLGRTTGVPREQQVSNGVGQNQAAQPYSCPMHPDVKSDKPGACPKCGMTLAMKQKDSRKRVPGYPQDMWMTMDAEVAKPETSWLPEGWTGSMMGMMTLVRVLPAEKYDRMMALIKEGKYEPGPKWPSKQDAPQHKHGE